MHCRSRAWPSPRDVQQVAGVHRAVKGIGRRPGRRGSRRSHSWIAGFSAAGVPVFVADVKGDLAGLAVPGSAKFKHADKLEGRAAELGMDDYAYADFRFFSLLSVFRTPARKGRWL